MRLNKKFCLLALTLISVGGNFAQMSFGLSVSPLVGFSKSEVDAILASLISGPNGLWDIDNLSPKLDAISQQIATRFGFTVAQAATVN